MNRGIWEDWYVDDGFRLMLHCTPTNKVEREEKKAAEKERNVRRYMKINWSLSVKVTDKVFITGLSQRIYVKAVIAQKTRVVLYMFTFRLKIVTYSFPLFLLSFSLPLFFFVFIPFLSCHNRSSRKAIEKNFFLSHVIIMAVWK